MNIILGSVASSIFDIDALRYIQAVEIADNQALEGSVKTAINTLVVGLKTDGIWSDISCCGILAGARTLNGALVPLKGPTPTNYNFVAGDYSRSLGLSGDGLTKYIDTNEPTNSRPLTSSHISVYMSKRMELSSSFTGNRFIAGVANTATNPFVSGQDIIGTSNTTAISGNIFCAIRGRGAPTVSPFTITVIGGNSIGFKGGTRTGTNFTAFRSNNTELTSGTAPTTPAMSQSLYLFAARQVIIGGLSTPTSHTNAGLTFYSIGSATDIRKLDNRVTTFMQTLSTLV